MMSLVALVSCLAYLANAQTPASLQPLCPAVQFLQALKTDDARNTRFSFHVTSGNMVAWVDVHYKINGGEMKNVRMVQTSPGAFEQPVEFDPASQSMTYFFTYCASVNNMAVDCDTELFATLAPTGALTQPQYQAPQPQYQAPQPQPQVIAPQPQYQAPQPQYQAPQPQVQPQYEAPKPAPVMQMPQYQQPSPLTQYTPPAAPLTAPAVQCPGITFTQSVQTANGGVQVIFQVTSGHMIEWVDIHYRIGSGELINSRMIQTTAGTLVVGPIDFNPQTETLIYFFTYCTMVNGAQLDCDTELFSTIKPAAALQQPQYQPAPLQQPQYQPAPLQQPQYQQPLQQPQYQQPLQQPQYQQPLQQPQYQQPQYQPQPQYQQPQPQYQQPQPQYQQPQPQYEQPQYQQPQYQQPEPEQPVQQAVAAPTAIQGIFLPPILAPPLKNKGGLGGFGGFGAPIVGAPLPFAPPLGGAPFGGGGY